MKLWWAFVDLDEKIHIKRYTTDRAVRNAQDSGTTLAICEPFQARNITDASYIILQKWREQRFFIKAGEPRIITQ